MARTNFAVAAIVVSLAAGHTYAETVDRRPAFEVALINHAPDAATEVATARARVGFLFGEAGIRVTWVAASEAPVELGRERIMLVLLDLPDGNRVFAGDARRLGFAMPPAHRVYVHYRRLYDLATFRHVQPGWFLGVVMAHELAHVLLPQAGHTADGIMAAALTPDPDRLPCFSLAEARQLRERLGAETLMALK